MTNASWWLRVEQHFNELLHLANPRHDRQKKSRFPTAVQRVQSAKYCLNSGLTLMPTLQKHSDQNQSKACFLVCPTTASHVLKTYECMGQSDVDDDDDDDEEEGSICTNDDSAEEVKNENLSTSRNSESNRCDCNGTSATTPNGRNPIISRKNNQTNNATTIQLEKPCKTSIELLFHALTNANGKDWIRQRPLIQNALGGRTGRTRIVPLASKAAIDAVFEQFNKQTSQSRWFRNKKIKVLSLDIRSFALSVAVNASATAVVGTKFASQVIPKLQQRFDVSLRQTYDLQSLELELKDCVTTILHSKFQKHREELQQDCNCFMDSLIILHLQQQTCGVLSREEVLSNCHSALLASTQTISTTLVGILLHLSERRDLQDLLKNTFKQQQEQPKRTNASIRTIMRSIIMETLRILPPVATLPRIVVCDETVTATTTCPMHKDKHNNCNVNVNVNKPSVGLLPPTSNDMFWERRSICTGDVLMIDLLSFAHTTIPQQALFLDQSDQGSNDKSTNSTMATGTNSSSVCTENTWKFNPELFSSENSSPSTSTCMHQSESSSRTLPTSYPFGMGKRYCPAAYLSLECLNNILLAIIVGTSDSFQQSNNIVSNKEFSSPNGYTWTLSNPHVDGVVAHLNDTHPPSRGWIASVLYTPTLTYPKPIMMTFTPRA